MEKEFYIYLSSDKSQEEFPFNKLDDFQVPLGEFLRFEPGWVCGITELRISLQTSETEVDLFLLSDICSTSYFDGNKFPFLRRIFLQNRNKQREGVQSLGKEQIFTNIYYLPVKKDYVNTLRVYMRKSNGHHIPFTSGKVHLTLHFKKLMV